MHIYVHEIEKYGRIFQTDPELGWSFIPGIEVDREKHDYAYRVITDADGHRVATPDEASPVERWRARDASRPSRPSRKVLVVGDSQTAGRGVDVEHRFDRLLDERRSDWSVLAVGTGGFGPCQELIVARRYFPDLAPGDVLVLMTTGNDFRDLLAKRPAGRSKPTCSIENEQLTLRPPVIGVREWLRDQSYIGYLVAKRLMGEPWREYSQSERAVSIAVYERIVATLAAELAQRDVTFVLAHNTDWLVWDDGTRDVFANLGRDPRIHHLALDPHVLGTTDPADSQNVLGDDIHWSASGHVIVADALETLLDQPEIAGASREPAVVLASADGV